MTMIGKYHLLASADNRWGVEWIDKSNKLHMITIHDFPGKIDDIVGKELAVRKHFADLFRLAMSKDTDAFLNSPDHEIINNIHEHELAPDKSITGDKLHEFYLRRFLKAYNRWKNMALQYREVEGLCSPNAG